jgi:hypothetical protein
MVIKKVNKNKKNYKYSPSPSTPANLRKPVYPIDDQVMGDNKPPEDP